MKDLMILLQLPRQPSLTGPQTVWLQKRHGRGSLVSAGCSTLFVSLMISALDALYGV